MREGLEYVKTQLFFSYLLCWRRHVSATVGHLQVTKMYVEENYTDYDHSIGAYSTYTMIIFCIVFPLYTFLWPEDGPQWPKHVVVSIINRIQDSCVLTYPTPSLVLFKSFGSSWDYTFSYSGEDRTNKYDYEVLLPTEGDERITTYCEQKVLRKKWSWPISVYSNNVCLSGSRLMKEVSDQNNDTAQTQTKHTLTNKSLAVWTNIFCQRELPMMCWIMHVWLINVINNLFGDLILLSNLS